MSNESKNKISAEKKNYSYDSILSDTAALKYHENQAKKSTIIMMSFFILLIGLFSWRIYYETTEKRIITSSRNIAYLVQQKYELNLNLDVYKAQLDFYTNANYPDKIYAFVDNKNYFYIESSEERIKDIINNYSNEWESYLGDEEFFGDLIRNHTLINLQCDRPIKDLDREFARKRLTPIWAEYYRQYLDTETNIIKKLCVNYDLIISVIEFKNNNKDFIDYINKETNSITECTQYLEENIRKLIKISEETNLYYYDRELFIKNNAGICEVNLDSLRDEINRIPNLSEFKKSIDKHLPQMEIRGNESLKNKESQIKTLENEIISIEADISANNSKDDSFGAGFIQSLWIYAFFAITALLGVQAGYQLNRAHKFEIVHLYRRIGRLKTIKEMIALGFNKNEIVNIAFPSDSINPFNPARKYTNLDTPQTTFLKDFTTSIAEQMNSQLKSMTALIEKVSDLTNKLSSKK